MSVPYNNIKRAFEEYYNIAGMGPNPIAINQTINRHLAHASSTDLTKLNMALSFNKTPFANHSADRLVVKFLQVLADGFDNYTSRSSHSSTDLHTNRLNYTTAINALALPVAAGAFFYNSFLSYSNSREIKLVEKAWATCAEQLGWGIQVASSSNAIPSCANLFRKYFGDPANNRAVILQNLKNVQTHMQSAATYFLYRGASANSASYKEPDGNANGFNSFAPVTVGDVAWASAEHHRHLVGLTSLFFADGIAMRNEPHAKTTKPKPLGFTYGGAILHELTHNVLNTIDVVLPPEVFTHLNKTVAQGVKSYGTNACRALAHVAPDLAITNADSYRIFCEDAFYFKPVV